MSLPIFFRKYALSDLLKFIKIRPDYKNIIFFDNFNGFNHILKAKEIYEKKNISSNYLYFEYLNDNKLLFNNQLIITFVKDGRKRWVDNKKLEKKPDGAFFYGYDKKDAINILNDLNINDYAIARQIFWDHQWKFIQDSKTKNLALVCGFNAGKTYVFLKKTLYCHLNIMSIDSVLEWQESGENPLFQPTSVGYIVYPTFPLAERLFIKPFIKMFKMKTGEDIKYDAKNHVLTSSYGTIIIISMTNVDNIIGDSACFVGIDEFDKEKTDKAIEVYEALQGRLRANGFKEGELKYEQLSPKNRKFIHPLQLYLVTTPEGYKATYIKFEKEKKEGTRLIRGRTLDNKAVSSDYIERLKNDYEGTPKLKAYLEGIFVNMKGKTVYQFFDREKHLAKNRIELNISLQVMLCFDFNVEPYCVAICQDHTIFNREKRQNIINEKSIKVIDEIILKGGKSNSHDIVAKIIARLPKEANIVLFGDASGNSHKTSAVSTDWEIIMQGLKPHFRSVEFAVERSNPPIEHRVNTVNYHLRKNHIEINPHCEFLINDLEQVSYKENGSFDTSNNMLTHISDAFGYYIYKKFSIYNRQY